MITITKDYLDISGFTITHKMGRTKSRPRPINKHKKFLGLPSPRQRLEKRNIYKLCISKLARIDDPQAKLCKAVLINNTLKNLEKQPEYLEDEDDVYLGPDTQTDCPMTSGQPTFESVCSYLMRSPRSDGDAVDTLSLCDDIISEFLGTKESENDNFICDKKSEDDKENVESGEESERSGVTNVSPYSYSSFLSEVYSVTLRKMKYKVDL